MMLPLRDTPKQGIPIDFEKEIKINREKLHGNSVMFIPASMPAQLVLS